MVNNIMKRVLIVAWLSLDVIKMKKKHIRGIFKERRFKCGKTQNEAWRICCDYSLSYIIIIVVHCDCIGVLVMKSWILYI